MDDLIQRLADSVTPPSPEPKPLTYEDGYIEGFATAFVHYVMNRDLAGEYYRDGDEYDYARKSWERHVRAISRGPSVITPTKQPTNPTN